MIKMIRDVLAAEVAAIQSIPDDNPFVECVSLFLESKHRGGKLVISGVGKAGEVGKKMATTFCSVGLPSVFLHPLEAQHGDLGILHEQDVLLLISNSGKTREVIELEWLARRLHKCLKVITMTGNTESELANKSDYVLSTGGPKEVCPLGLAPTTSTTTMVVIGDVLAVLVVHISGYGADDYALRHHSGYLGQKSREAGAGDKLPRADEIELRHAYEALHKENVDLQNNNS
jgi:arabinose-5-phosphate isomerase